MNGFTKIPNELMRNPNLPPIAKVVWSLIAGMAPGFDATLSQYCKMVACHPDTWRSIIKMLESFGMVAVEHRPNGVKYSAITDTSRWAIPSKEGMKNSHPMKNSEGMKNSHRKGMKISGGEGMKISHPSEEHIKEQKKNNIDVDARTRVREEVMSDEMVEMGCMSLGIDRGTYENLAFQVFTDWDFQNLPDSEWTKTHFLAVMRYKVADYKKINNNGQRTNQNGNIPVQRVSGFKILNKA